MRCLMILFTKKKLAVICVLGFLTFCTHTLARTYICMVVVNRYLRICLTYLYENYSHLLMLLWLVFDFSFFFLRFDLFTRFEFESITDLCLPLYQLQMPIWHFTYSLRENFFSILFTFLRSKYWLCKPSSM